MTRIQLVVTSLFALNAFGQGDGFTVEPVSPAVPNVMFAGPVDAKVFIAFFDDAVAWKRPSAVSHGYDECRIPCQVPAKSNEGVPKSLRFKVTLKSGETWVESGFVVSPRTEYRISVDVPPGAAGAPGPWATKTSVAAPARASPLETKPEPVVPAAPVAAPVAAGAAAMPSSQFEQLKQAIADAEFPATQHNVLAAGARNARFDTQQVGALLELFTFANDRLKVVEKVSGSIVDRENAMTLLTYFDMPADKDKASRLLSR